MAKKCDVCGKGPQAGNNVSHSNLKTRRRWLPNLHTVKTVVNGAPKKIKICTRCLRSKKLQSATAV